jgi:Fic family protein
VKPTDFGPRKTGTLVNVGLPGIPHAFNPDPLPASWTWPPELWPVLLEAHKALSALDGTGKHLSNPELLLRPLQKREAQKSSTLEGTYTDPQQQVLFDLEPSLGDTDETTNARREVFNYARALDLRRKTRDELPISLRLIKELHRVLMSGVRGAEKNPGDFRRLQNQIGRPARYVPPPVTLMAEQLDRFEKYLHGRRQHDPLVEAFIAHYQFEAIHPFMDGNGRVGRLLLAILIEDWCGLSNQWLYMSDYFDRNKDEYFDRLLRVSTHGDWTGWIAFCLAGVVQQALDTMRRYERLISLYRDYHEKVLSVGGNLRLFSIVDGLFNNPVARVTTTAAECGVSYPTARTDLRRLESAGIIKHLQGSAPITYVCVPILDIIYSD